MTEQEKDTNISKLGNQEIVSAALAVGRIYLDELEAIDEGTCDARIYYTSKAIGETLASLVLDEQALVKYPCTVVRAENK